MDSELIVLKGPPYKGVMGHWITRQLFADVFYKNVAEPERRQYAPVFTLERQVEGLVCAHDTFIELRDPTGFQWAMKYLGSYDHWLVISEASWFKPALERWREELDMLFTSEAIQRIREIASGGSQAALPASKYLAEKGWMKTRGRPSKQELAGELKRQAQKFDEFEEDRQRMFGVVNGGKLEINVR